MEEAKYPNLHIWHDSIMKTKKYRWQDLSWFPKGWAFLKIQHLAHPSIHPTLLFLEVSEGEAEAGLAATLTWHKTDLHW